MNIEEFIEKQFSNIEMKNNDNKEDATSIRQMLSILIQIIEEHDLLDKYYDRYMLLKTNKYCVN